LVTHREEDKKVLRGKAAAKGATVIFWRLAGGAEDALLALRVLLLDLVAIFFFSSFFAELRTLSLPPVKFIEATTFQHCKCVPVLNYIIIFVFLDIESFLLFF